MVKRHENNIKPNIEEAITINIRINGIVREGAQFTSEHSKAMTKLLREYPDIFAWSYQDMPGLYTDIVENDPPL